MFRRLCPVCHEKFLNFLRVGLTFELVCGVDCGIIYGSECIISKIIAEEFLCWEIFTLITCGGHMKTKELKKVPRNKIGRVNKNGVKSEPGEEKTFEFLALLGFDIELIIPTHAQKIKNPDVLIAGTIWEVKTPTSHNENTIKNRFREAADQATHIVFDLRYVKRDHEKVEKQLIGLFKDKGRVRRMIIIEKSGKTVDFIK